MGINYKEKYSVSKVVDIFNHGNKQMAVNYLQFRWSILHVVALQARQDNCHALERQFGVQ